MKVWYIIGVGALALSVYGLMQLAKAGADLVTNTKTRLHSIDTGKAIFAINVQIKNPNPTALTIQFPFVTITYKGQVIASSLPRKEMVVIAPLSLTEMNTLYLEVPFYKLSGVAVELIQKFLTKQTKLEFEVHLSTRVQTGLVNTSYSQTKPFSI
jgi:ribosomal protein L31E